MERREALASLATLAASAGLTVSPITTREAQAVDLVVLKVKQTISMDTMARIQKTWQEAVKGTSLEHTKAVVLSDDIELELVKGKT